MIKICALLPTHQHIRNSAHHSRLNVSRYFGLKVIINEIEKALNLSVSIVDYSSVHQYDIVLSSIHSVEDYYSHAYTQLVKMKGKRKGIWIAGGAAVQNLPPLVPLYDYIVVGRGESIIIPLLKAIIYGHSYSHQSVIYTSQYNQSANYKINYAQQLYKDQIGKEKETMLGCKYNCAYCRYRISSLPPNMRENDRNTTMPGNEETFWELDITSGQQHTTSLDGLTEEIRFAVTKRISNESIIKKFESFSKSLKVLNLKIYLIVGYPGLPELDFSQLIDVFNQISLFLSDHRYTVKFHVTPFSAEPGTPMQWERVNIEQNYNQLMKDYYYSFGHPIDTNNLKVIIQQTTMSNWTVLKRSIHHRAWQSDFGIISDIVCNPYFKSHNNTHTDKINHFLKHYDVTPFIREYPIGSELSSSNITSWRSLESIMRQGTKVRGKLSSLCLSNPFLL